MASDDAESSTPFVVDVEVCLQPTCTTPLKEVEERVRALLDAASLDFVAGLLDMRGDPVLRSNVVSARVADLPDGVSRVPYWRAETHVHIYQLNADGPGTEEATAGEGDEAVVAAQQFMLPATEFEGLWESLVFDSDVKQNLLDYASTALWFADRGVDGTLVSLNRVVLLHGPPGTGKTTLCKGLAQKLAVRLAHRFPQGALLEINAHSLFSKWFSESGKLVARLFEHIRELVDEPDAFICVLIDEVESLTAARKAALAGTEPSDAVRVVNALLTQLDALRARPNVLILTTSNITEAIDVAFIDRADVKQYIGPPSHRGRYDILRTCVRELRRASILLDDALLPDFGDVHPTFCSLAEALRGEAEEARSGPLPSSSASSSSSSAPVSSSSSAPPSSAAFTSYSSTPFPSHRPSSSSSSSSSVSSSSSSSSSVSSSSSSASWIPDVRVAASGPTRRRLDSALEAAWLLWCAAGRAEGLSGRSLRKLPFQAQAFVIRAATCTTVRFLEGLDVAVLRELDARAGIRMG